jgi:hypothetical protein
VRRVGENDRVIGIAGIVGHVRQDLSVHLSLARLSAPAKAAAVALYDCGVFGSTSTEQLYVARLPTASEAALIREPSASLSRPRCSLSPMR